MGRHQRRYEGIAAVEHHLDRVAVEPDAVLDGGNAGLQRVLDPGVGLRVGHHLPTLSAPLLHRRPYLIERQRGVVRLVTRREHAAGGAELDPVGAGADDLTDSKTHRLDPIDHLVRPVGQRDVEVGAAHEVCVGVAASLAERADRDEHARSGKVTGVDGHADARGRTGCVAHRRESRFERPLGGAHRAHELEGRRRDELAREVEAFAQGCEVDVAVDEPRQTCEPRCIDRFRVARDLGSVPRSGPGDAPVFDKYDRLTRYLTGGGIEEGVAENGAEHEPMLDVRCRVKPSWSVVPATERNKVSLAQNAPLAATSNVRFAQSAPKKCTELEWARVASIHRPADYESAALTV